MPCQVCNQHWKPQVAGLAQLVCAAQCFMLAVASSFVVTWNPCLDVLPFCVACIKSKNDTAGCNQTTESFSTPWLAHNTINTKGNILLEAFFTKRRHLRAFCCEKHRGFWLLAYNVTRQCTCYYFVVFFVMMMMVVVIIMMMMVVVVMITKSWWRKRSSFLLVNFSFPSLMAEVSSSVYV